ncbi:uncharacterized protein LOC117108434 [Anneissia japonica]|uniref:uncharacterized protein LOC117108434 n=1 Tax=Anneissia japonica TaxID=1529436 RepID=UPI001425A2A2|nr:uncharacterized protein LOC117108434 [Anneissia japonica]
MHSFKGFFVVGVFYLVCTMAQMESESESESVKQSSSVSEIENNSGESEGQSEIESESEGSDGGGEAPESSATIISNGNIEDSYTQPPPSGDVNFLGTIESTTSVVIGAVVAAVGIVSISAAVAVYVMVQRRKQRL